jgi:hypothetical protein
LRFSSFFPKSILQLTLFFILFFVGIEDSRSAGVSAKYINLIVEDTLYYPVSLLINKFVLNNNLVVNARYVNAEYIRNLEFDESINIIITQSKNRDIIKKFFNIKSDIFLGNTSYCLCAHVDKKASYKNVASLNDILKQNNFDTLAIGDRNSNFFVGGDVDVNAISIFDNADDAIQSIYFKKNDIGLFLFPMCEKELGMKVLHSVTSSDAALNNFDNMNIEYRIYVVNYLNNNVQSFLSFITNSRYIYDLLKNYGILDKTRQFSN